MKARFDIKSIKAQWKPPFKKEVTEEVFDVEENEKFDKIIGNGNNEYVFKLIRFNNDFAEIEYSKLFTLKTGNPNKYIITINRDQTVDMAYLWGEDGVTKKITYKGIIMPSETKTNEINSNDEINETKTNDIKDENTTENEVTGEE
jgi:hypothetical protein